MFSPADSLAMLDSISIADTINNVASMAVHNLEEKKLFLKTADYLIITAYFLVILVVGVLTGRKQEKEDFLISGRKLTSFQATTTIFSSRIGAAILLTYTALVFIYGMGALWYFVGSVFGLFVFYFFGLKMKKIADKEKFYTMPDYFFFYKGKTAGYLATIVTIVIMFGWVVLNFTAGGKLVSEYTNISYNWSVIIVGSIILIYLIMGGFDAVVKTDVIQTFGIFLLFVLMIYLLSDPEIAKPQLLAKDLFHLPVMKLVSFFLAGFFIPLASPELWQRVYAIKDKKHFRRSIIMSSLFYIIVGFILLLVGLVIKAEMPTIDANTSLIKGFAQLLPVGLAGLSVVIIYSAVSSSADTYMFTAAASVSQDFLEKAGLTQASKLKFTVRWSMLALMLLGVVISLILKDIVDTTFFFVSLTMSLGLLILVMWIYPKINRISVNLSILLCLLGVLIPSAVIGISKIGENLVIWAFAFCLAGVALGLIIDPIVKAVKKHNAKG
jgi:Na+/proline symporter